jgi:predicted DNA-binding transcriptional regulator AlpA
MIRRPPRPAHPDTEQPDRASSSQCPYAHARRHLERGRGTPAEPERSEPPRTSNPHHLAQPRRRTVAGIPRASVHNDSETARSRRCSAGWRSPNKDRHSAQGTDRLLTVDEVAQWLGKPKATLYVWRTRGLGPRGIKVGNALRYRRRDVEAWLDQQADDR